MPLPALRSVSSHRTILPAVLLCSTFNEHSALHGRGVSEFFEGEGGGDFEGTVKSHLVHNDTVTFVIEFEDGDLQEYSRDELEAILL